MIIEQIYTGCLAQGAYYIESEGEAVIIDPLREVQPYINKAKRNNARIKYVLETHFHADFVSGHLDLSRKTGAPIVYGPTAKPDFNFYAAKDGEELKVKAGWVICLDKALRYGDIEFVNLVGTESQPIRIGGTTFTK